MASSAVLLVLTVFVVLIAYQVRAASGIRRGLQFIAIAAPLFLGGAWLVFARIPGPAPLPEDQTALPPLTAQNCFRCHEAHYASWHQTFHRTMTREATPEYVKGKFDGVAHQHLGVTARMVRDKDRFFMECEPQDGASRRVKFSIDRLVGSHWFQQLLHRDAQGRYLRLPMAYHIAEERWVHINGCFLAPEHPEFFRFALWNKTCLYCHNTRPAKNPLPGRADSYRTTVGELGISCEACHGAGERHVLAHQNPARRLVQHYSEEADPTIVNPAKLSVGRSVEVCGHCHGGTVPRYKEWNLATLADPYLPGRDLKRFWYVPFSEENFKLFNQGVGACCDFPGPQPPAAHDGRFWGDGTPLATATEYQGIIMSACYQDGRGQMTCLTCHSMHKSDPNHQVKEGMRTNAACYACHADYKNKLVEHTHHPAGSQGSLCFNCHMANQVYGLLGTHRSHRISIPRVRDSIGTGKPHACNLCHLDKSLGWTQEQLGTWYKTKPEKLSEDERAYASSVLELARGDARTRAVFAAAFSWPPAQEASGKDWPVLLLTRVLEQERFQAVRYCAHKALRSLHGGQVEGYDYQGPPEARAVQLRELRAKLESAARLERRRYPYLPLTEAGMFENDVWERLLKTRKDPDVNVNE